MGKYIQCNEKKKICPRCNGKVYNATLTCKLLKDNKRCGYKFISRKQKELSDIMNELINNIIETQNISEYNDIKVINRIAKFKDLRCLSLYEERSVKMISPKKIEIPNLKPVKLFCNLEYKSKK